MSRKKITEEVIKKLEVLKDELPTSSPELSEKMRLFLRRDELYELRNQMVQNGVDSIGKLDNLIAEVLKRISQLILEG